MIRGLTVLTRIPREAGWTWFDLSCYRYRWSCGYVRSAVRLIVANFIFVEYDSAQAELEDEEADDA